MPKSFLIDTSRCTACRGCQLACKEWNELAPNSTKQRGTHQNPPDLNVNNYKLVRFSEHLVDGRPAWYFFPDQCRHCIEPPCKQYMDSVDESAAYHDKATGAVVFTKASQKVDADPLDLCPYNIPRRDEQTGVWKKCTMCYERITRGMLPACVKVCPTGTMNFGERVDMLQLAEKRLAEVKKAHPRAMLADAESVNVIFLLMDDPMKFHEYSVAALPERLLDRKSFLARLALPFKAMSNGIA